MDSANAILNHLKETPANNTPDGYCPNCWGRQEYGGQFYESVKEINIDINKPNPTLGWIQEYAAKNLAPIRLKKEGDGLSCANCQLTYSKDH